MYGREPMPSADTIRIQRTGALRTVAVLECLRSAFAPFELAYTAAAYEDTVLTSEAFVRRLEQTVFMAADGNGRVVGTVACSMMSEAEGHLRGMAVQPAWQASGTADRLLQYAEDELIKRNCRRITLDTTQPLQRAMRLVWRDTSRPSGASTWSR